MYILTLKSAVNNVGLAYQYPEYICKVPTEVSGIHIANQYRCLCTLLYSAAFAQYGGAQCSGDGPGELMTSVVGQLYSETYIMLCVCVC